jgi:hypothetical protein
MRRRVLNAGAAVLFLACGSDSVAAVRPPAFYAGTWARVENVLASQLTMTLVVVETTVTGSGSFSIEAGRSGTLSVSGVVTSGVVKLDLAFDYGEQAHFQGTADASGRLAGTIKYGPPDGAQSSQSVSFQRQ